MGCKTLLAVIAMGAAASLALGIEFQIGSTRSAGRPAVQEMRSDVSPSGGAVAHWRFTGTPGAVPENGEKIQDLTSRWPATVSSTLMYRSVEGTSGLEFNGRNDRLFVVDDPAFELTGSLTLEAIIRCDGVFPGSHFQNQIVMRGDDRPGLDPWFLAVSLDGRLMFHIQNARNEYAQVLSPGPLPAGRIIHIAGVLNTDTKEMDLFIDGKRVSSAATNLRPFGRLETGASPGVGIGNIQSGTYQQGFNGLIAEIRITNRALRPAEFLRVPRPGPQQRDTVPRTKRGRTYREMSAPGKNELQF